MATWKRIPTVNDKLSVFASTTSAELAGVLTNETGFSSGAVSVFSISPALTGSPTAPTQAASEDSTKLATTAYVDRQAALGDTSLSETKIWIGASGGTKAEFSLSGDATMTAGGVVSVSGGTAGVATSITAVANNSTDETVYPTFVDAATGTQGIETDTGLTYNPSSGVMTGTRWTGAVTGDVTGDASGSSGTCTGLAGSATVLATSRTIGGVGFDGSANINLPGVNATGNQDTTGDAARVTSGTQSSITSANNLVSVGTLTALQVDNINLNGSAITGSTAADLVINVTDGQSVVVEGLDIDDGVVTGASSITSTTFVGALTGQASTVATIAGLAPNTATTQATQGAITSAANLATVGALNSGSITSGFGTIDTGASNITTTGTIYAGDLTVTNELTAASGTVTLTGQVAINDEIVILNSDVTGAIGAGVDVGFEVERGDNVNAKLIWDEAGATTIGSRWIVQMQDSSGSGYKAALAVMGTDTTKEELEHSFGRGAFYEDSGALYCYI